MLGGRRVRAGQKGVRYPYLRVCAPFGVVEAYHAAIYLPRASIVALWQVARQPTSVRCPGSDRYSCNLVTVVLADPVLDFFANLRR